MKIGQLSGSDDQVEAVTSIPILRFEHSFRVTRIIEQGVPLDADEQCLASHADPSSMMLRVIFFLPAIVLEPGGAFVPSLFLSILACQKSLNFFRQLHNGVWLLDKADAVAEAPARIEFAVATGNKNRHIGTNLPYVPEGFLSTHDGHGQV